MIVTSQSKLYEHSHFGNISIPYPLPAVFVILEAAGRGWRRGFKSKMRIAEALFPGLAFFSVARPVGRIVACILIIRGAVFDIARLNIDDRKGGFIKSEKIAGL